MTATIQALDPSLICLGSLEGSGRARHLVKRLRGACPDIPILVGCWGLHGAAELRAELRAAGADEVVSTLAEARAAVACLIQLSGERRSRMTRAKASERQPSGVVTMEPAVKEAP